MADIELVINISEEMYKHVSTSDAYVLDDVDFILLENAIANGTPLPKGHGELIDRNALIHEYEVSNIIHHYGTQIVKVAENARVVVKADKGEE